MIGAAIGAGLQLATGIIQGIKGRKMRKQGEKMMRETRPKMKIPGAIDANYAQAQNELGGKPAIQQAIEDSTQQQLAGNLSAVRRYATSSADALAAASGANNVAGQGMAEAAAAGGQQRSQNLQTAMRAGSELGDYQSLQWDMNVNQPYLQRMEFAQGRMAAGQAQEQAGLSSMGGAMGGIGSGIDTVIGRKKGFK
jgi:hypothetical protein